MKLNQNQKKLFKDVKELIGMHYTNAIILEADLNMIVSLADKIYTSEKKEDLVRVPKEEVDEVYTAYPTKCVVRGASTGKSASNKNKIRTLPKSSTKEELLLIISKYIADCKKDKVYMKNFTTFLNNLPDYDIETLKSESSTLDSNNNKSKNTSQWQ